MQTHTINRTQKSTAENYIVTFIYALYANAYLALYLNQ